MSGDGDFAGMLEQIRQGDEQAAAALVQRYEPELRRYIRFRLTSPTVRRFVDSLDICQSVLARFFTHLESEDVTIASADQLKALLITMARNRTLDAVSAQHAQRRDARRSYGNEEQLSVLASTSETPSHALEMEEIVTAVRSALSDNDRYLVDQRMNGRGWSELAVEQHVSAEAMRKQVTRAINKVALDLKLVE